MQAKRLVVTALVFGFLMVCASAVRVEALPKSITIGSKGQTADKPQSKLWYHDGRWWAILPDATKNFYFYRMVDGVFQKGALVGLQPSKSHADVLWDPPHLFVLVFHKPTSSEPNQRLYKYEWNAGAYTLMPGFPVDILLQSVNDPETATIVKDTTNTTDTPGGKLWIAHRSAVTVGTSLVYKIRVIWSIPCAPLPSDPPEPPLVDRHRCWDTTGQILDSKVTNDDIVALVAFNNTPTEPRVGAMWSDQVNPAPSKHFGWTSHIDGALETAWDPPDPGQTLVSGESGDESDDHVHLTVTPGQDILAATKATNDDRIHVRIRPDGSEWETPKLVTTYGTRPIVLSVHNNDQGTDEAYVFYTYPFATGVNPPPPTAIVYKKAPLSSLADISNAPAITVLREPSGSISDITSTKDYVDTDSSLVVAAKAASSTQAYYTSIVMHAETKTGVSTGSASVTSADLTGKRGHLYLAAIVTTPPVDVFEVTGLGLENWQRVAVQCSGKDQTEVTVYRAYATSTSPTSPIPVSGAVTATLSGTPTNAVIAVSRYSGVDLTTPIGNVKSGNTRGIDAAAVCDPVGGTDTANYSFDLGSPTVPIIDGAVLYGAVAMLDKSHTEGLNFTERKEVAQGSGSMTAGLAVEDKPAPAAGSDTVLGTFSGIVDWAGIAIELRPPYTP